MVRLLLIPAVLLALLAGAVVWSREAGAGRADFAFVNRGDVKTLDLNNMSWEQDIRLAYALWEGLYTTDPVTLRPIPGAADRIDLTPDGCTYTFHLRPDGKWSNGDPVTADDFAFEWRRMLESPGAYTGLHFYVKGAEAYSTAYAAYLKAMGEGNREKPPVPPDFGTVGERVLDPLTFRVTLTQPVAYFPACCAFPPFFPLNQKVMATFAVTDPKTGAISYKPEYTRPPNLVTNGPYRLDSWTFKQRLRMVANEHYWNRAAVGCRTVDQVYAEDPLAALRLYQSGTVDWLCDVDGETAAAMLKRGGYPDLHVFPGFGTYYYELNCQEKLPDGRPNPLRDVRVRRALAMAIDKGPIVTQVGRMNQPVATTYIPVGVFPGYKSPAGLPYDVPAAQKLLAEAGYPNGVGLMRLPIRFNTDGPHGDIAVIIAGQWKRNLGVDTEMQGTEQKQFADDLHHHKFTVSRASWSGDYDDPSTFTDKYLPKGDDNDAGWDDTVYGDLCTAAAKERDPTRRFDLLSQAEARLLDQCPIIPIYTYVGAYLFHDDVHGMSLSPRKVQMFQAIRVDRKQ